MFFSAFVKAFSQLFDVSLRKWLGYSLLLAIGTIAGLMVVTGLVLDSLALSEDGSVKFLIQALGVLGNVILAFLLFPGVMVLWIGIFADPITRAVEQKYYPQDPPGQDVPIGVGIRSAVKFFGLWAGLNLVLVLPSLMIPIPLVTTILFYGVNAWLLSREFFEQAALRHVPIPIKDEMVERYGRKLTFNGVFITFLHQIPFLNLFAPVMSLAAMLHIFKELAQQDQQLAGQAMDRARPPVTQQKRIG